jgi:glycosyltransferase involved in cell wall biosynthesis
MSAEEREKIGQNGRAYFREHFDHDRLVDQLVDHLHELTLSFGKK